MDSAQFNALVGEARAREDALLLSKGADYTRHDPDRLSNFKRVGTALGIDPLVVWAIYAGKHWDAIMAFVKTGRAESEAIESRLDDLRNYLYLAEGLIAERKRDAWH